MNINNNQRKNYTKFFNHFALKHTEICQKWLPHGILGGKMVKNVQIDAQTTEIWPKELNVR